MPGPRDVHALLAQGRSAEALALSGRLAGAGVADSATLSAHAAALKANGRMREALLANREAVTRFPANAIAWHNLAATLGDMDHPEEGEAAARKAIALGLAAPETRLVLARALQAQNRFDHAEAAFREAVALRPAYADAQRELAQLLWMRSGDRALALEALDRARAAHPRDTALSLVRTTLLDHSGDQAGALETVSEALSAAPADVPLLSAAAYLSGELGAPAAALAYARRAAATAPGVTGVEMLLAKAHLALGELDAAEPLAERCVARAPQDQSALALLAVIWRLRDDPRYRALYDYDAFVRTFELEAPDGWTSRDAFLGDVAAALDRQHGFVAHPFAQSVRGGSQITLPLDGSSAAPLEALLDQLRACAAAFARDLGPGDDPLRRRNPGDAEITGAWSVKLSSAGFHTDHVHSRGWLSSACYVRLPVFEGGAQAGWIKFGEPGVRTPQPLAAEHFVEPRPGRLVLFPAYMWHGTVPFAAADSRLTVAFDALPAGR